ncbi:hypothetical protein AJ87_25180 [Rhizobium yanglingense]|nr:hypothetical protein AJ87_25180 [Rhizobium yanglingense]
MSQIRTVFQRERWSIVSTPLIRLICLPELRGVCLYGLALHANVGDAATDHANAHAFSDFDFQFLVVDDLRYLADEATGRDDLSPRRIALKVSARFLAWARCGRISRKYQTTISGTNRMIISKPEPKGDAAASGRPGQMPG